MAGEDVKIGALRRRRNLVDALTQQGMQGSQGQMVGQVYVAPSWLEAFSRPLSALAGAYAGQKMDEEEAQLQQQKSQGLADVLAGLQGKQGMDFTSAALSSEYPEAQALGLKNFEYGLNPRNQEKFGTSMQLGSDPVTGELVNVLTSNRGNQKVSQYKPFEKPTFVGGEAVIPSQAVPGQLYGREPKGVTVNTNLPKQESAFGKKMGEKDAERYDNANTILQNEASQADMINRIKQLEELPVLRGGLAPLAVKAAQIGATLGVPVPEQISNAEQLDAIIEGAVVQFIQQGGRGITDEEGKRMVKTWPGLLQTAEGAKKVRQQMEEINARNIRQAKTTQKILSERYPDAFPKQQGRSVTRTGRTADGRKVVQYSDGSIEYGD